MEYKDGIQRWNTKDGIKIWNTKMEYKDGTQRWNTTMECKDGTQRYLHSTDPDHILDNILYVPGKNKFHSNSNT